ncbi:MAG: hypothetical protein NXI31_01530 [bacterium]|nr:hypothetical protein [bacterium]
MLRRALAPVAAGLFVACASAQTIQAGWLGVCSASTTSLSYVNSGGAVFGLSVSPNFGGTISPGTAQSILHDPLDPDVFWCGGFGFVGRARVTASNSVNYSLLTNAVGTATQMSFDGQGDVWVADAWTAQIRRVDRQGVVTSVSAGVQPWGGSLSAGTVDPATNDYYAGGNGALYRLASGQATAVPFVTGLGGPVTGVAIDPCTGEILAAVGQPGNRLVRIDAGAVAHDLIAPGNQVIDPQGIVVGSDGNFLTGGAFGSVFCVERLSGIPRPLVTNAVPGTVTSVTVTRVQGDGQACAFGDPCGSVYGVPWLRTFGPNRPGRPAFTSSVNHRPGTLGAIALGTRALPTPLSLDPFLGTTGCFQFVDSVVQIAHFADAAGNLSFAVATNPAFAGVTVFVQHAALDGNQLGDFALSNAVRMQF